MVTLTNVCLNWPCLCKIRAMPSLITRLNLGAFLERQSKSQELPSTYVLATYYNADNVNPC